MTIPSQGLVGAQESTELLPSLLKAEVEISVGGKGTQEAPYPN